MLLQVCLNCSIQESRNDPLLLFLCRSMVRIMASWMAGWIDSQPEKAIANAINRAILKFMAHVRPTGLQRCRGPTAVVDLLAGESCIP